MARSRTAHLAFLRNLHSALGATTAVAVLIAGDAPQLRGRPYGHAAARARSPMTMREMAATGDLTREDRAAPTPTLWDDEDARLLAATFNTLTDSIARFQREAAQRERLSSLGRLSTVIAHEVRNPLMIIKGSLRRCGAGAPSPEDVAGVAADIDGEVARLNRVVNDVLDFARPIRFDLAPIDIDASCRDAAQAAVAGQAGRRR